MCEKVTCFVCGYRTLEARCDWDICPICFWEDDVLLKDDNDRSSPANRGMSLAEAQANFMILRASSKDRVPKVRAPGPGDERDPKWKPLSKAFDLVKTLKDVTDH